MVEVLEGLGQSCIRRKLNKIDCTSCISQDRYFLHTRVCIDQLVEELEGVGQSCIRRNLNKTE
jgi:hypothetical protein